MRWIVVFIFLYIVPIIILFKNHKSFRRACIYSSIYTVLATSIAISNIYLSELDSIKEVLYYQNTYQEENISEKHKSKEHKIEINKEETDDKTTEIKDIDKEEDLNFKNNRISIQEQNEINKKNIENTSNKVDLNTVYEFKKDIYEIESIALVPMRECVEYTKNITKSLGQIETIQSDVEYAQDMCNKVIGMYNDMDIPHLSKEEYTEVLYLANQDLINTYKLREQAMEYGMKLVETKNPKYIAKIKEYLDLSDKQISSFKNRTDNLIKNMKSLP